LIQAVERLRTAGIADRVRLVGVDLVEYFDPSPSTPALELVVASVTTWSPPLLGADGLAGFDLVTCVQGLHYVGDKLGVVARAASWLTDTGLLVADLDLTSVRLGDGRPAGRVLAAALRSAGFSYDTRRRRVTCAGRRIVTLPYTYLGADDRWGPNYTGQPAVASYYDRSG
jgi:hypothetical protein